MNIIDYFAFTKRTHPTQTMEFPGAALIPLNEGNVKSDGFAFLLSMWRNNQRSAYPSQFVATQESTASWMQSVMDNPIRQFWYVVDVNFDNQITGTVGLMVDDCDVYLDFIQRGYKGLGTPGLVRNACSALIQLVRSLEPNRPAIFLKVLSSNINAQNVYRGMGFQFDSFQVCDLQNDTIGPGSVLYKPTGEVVAQLPLTDVPGIIKMKLSL